jgi:hypothetical protein
MMDERKFETLLADALGRRGRPAPFPIDVATRVMARVSVMGPPPRAEMSYRQFGRWAIAACATGIALTLVAAWQAPSLSGALPDIARTVADATAAALKLAPPASALAGTAGRVASALVASGRTLVQPLEPFQPLARVMLAALTLVMLSITTVVVGRDVAKGFADKERA